MFGECCELSFSFVWSHSEFCLRYHLPRYHRMKMTTPHTTANHLSSSLWGSLLLDQKSPSTTNYDLSSRITTLSASRRCTLTSPNLTANWRVLQPTVSSTWSLWSTSYRSPRLWSNCYCRALDTTQTQTLSTMRSWSSIWRGFSSAQPTQKHYFKNQSISKFLYHFVSN